MEILPGYWNKQVPENGYPLTDEQITIATAPPEQPQMVVAPPGAGKTPTVIARIQYLVEQGGLDPAGELLVHLSTIPEQTTIGD